MSAEVKDKKLIISLVIGGFIFVLVVSIGVAVAFISLLRVPESNNTISSNVPIVSDQLTISSSTTSEVIPLSLSSSSVSSGNKSSSKTITPPPPVTSKLTTSVATSTLPKYKTGTFSAIGPYNNQHGINPINLNVSLTLFAGKILSENVSGSSSEQESNQFILRFIQREAGSVVGKLVDQAYLYGQLSGASLTAQGFNAALTNIIKQATN